MRGPLSRPQVLASSHDVELAAFTASGDRAAFGELVRRHGSAVRGLLRRMGAEPGLADDLARDAFLAAFEQISEFRGEGAFQAWVRRIAARLFAKRQRRDGGLDLSIEAGAAEPCPAPDGTADLDRALTSLGAAERLCVSFCYGAGLSHAETAELMTLSGPVVKSHIRRGLDRLRPRLASTDRVDRAEGQALADPTFEVLLDRLFGQSPDLSDQDAFAAGVRRRLDRSWTLRRLVIGGLGVVGGLIGVGQLAASGVVGRAHILSVQSSRLASIAVANHLPERLFADLLPLGSDVLWAAGVLCLLALALAVMRAIGDI